MVNWMEPEDKNIDIFEWELVTELVTELASYRVRVELFRSVLYLYNIYLIYIETYSVSLDGTKGIAATGEGVDCYWAWPRICRRETVNSG